VGFIKCFPVAKANYEHVNIQLSQQNKLLLRKIKVRGVKLKPTNRALKKRTWQDFLIRWHLSIADHRRINSLSFFTQRVFLTFIFQAAEHVVCLFAYYRNVQRVRLICMRSAL
jgi:hypothetical protein